MNKKLNLRNLLKIIAIIFLIIGAICLVLSFYLLFSNPSYFIIGDSFNIEIANKFGGFVAGVTGVFFSVTATFLIFLTFEQQKEQFKLSQFDNSFFNLFRILQNIIEELTISDEYNNTYQSREYLRYQRQRLVQFIVEENSKLPVEKELAEIVFNARLVEGFLDENNLEKYGAYISKILSNFFKSKGFSFEHYFRSVHNLMKYIEDSQLNKFNKKRYFNIIKAQMTMDELGLIFYYGLSQEGKGDFHFLLDSSNFLSIIDKGVLENDKNHIRLYPMTNFNFKK